MIGYLCSLLNKAIARWEVAVFFVGRAASFFIFGDRHTSSQSLCESHLNGSYSASRCKHRAYSKWLDRHVLESNRFWDYQMVDAPSFWTTSLHPTFCVHNKYIIVATKSQSKYCSLLFLNRLNIYERECLLL